MLPKGAISAVALPNSEERLWLSAPSPPPGWLTAGSAGWAERRHGALQQPPRLLILLQPARLKPQLAHSLIKHLAASGMKLQSENFTLLRKKALQHRERNSYLQGLQDTEKMMSAGTDSQGNLGILYAPLTPLLGCTRLPFSSLFGGTWESREFRKLLHTFDLRGDSKITACWGRRCIARRCSGTNAVTAGEKPLRNRAPAPYCPPPRCVSCCNFRGLREARSVLGMTSASEIMAAQRMQMGFKKKPRQYTQGWQQSIPIHKTLSHSSRPPFMPREAALLFTLAFNPPADPFSQHSRAWTGLHSLPTSRLLVSWSRSTQVRFPPLPSTAGCPGRLSATAQTPTHLHLKFLRSPTGGQISVCTPLPSS